MSPGRAGLLAAAAVVLGAAGGFPQPVQVGQLIGRAVLRPVEAQDQLGRVRAVVRRADGGLDLVLARGGLFGFGTTLVAVPLDAVALLGEHVALIDLTPAQLAALPATPHPGQTLPAETVVRMGLVRPFH